METYIKGVPLPVIRPVPFPVPVETNWYDIVGKAKLLSMRTGSRKWELAEDYIIYLPWLNVEVCIPKGFIFDGASIPRVFWAFMSPTGLMFIPGLLHDFGYRYGCWVDKNYNVIDDIQYDQKFFDDAFRDTGVYANDSTITSNVTWSALRTFGFFAWRSHRKRCVILSSDYPPKTLA